MAAAASYSDDSEFSILDSLPPAEWRFVSYLYYKAVMDRCLALLILIPALPLMGVLVLLIKATSPGPGFYSQVRVGREGRLFTMYKLRSMRVDAESQTGPVWSPSGRDPRVTWLGFWLRKLHLDELPQLFNVLKGEMSLIGPRPERPMFVSKLSESIPGYLERLSVAPGITGLAQINLPPDSDLDDVRRKLVLDRQYIATAGPALDLQILACTFLHICGLNGERTVRLLGLNREVVLEPRDAAEYSETPMVAATATSSIGNASYTDTALTPEFASGFATSPVAAQC